MSATFNSNNNNTLTDSSSSSSSSSLDSSSSSSSLIDIVSLLRELDLCKLFDLWHFSDFEFIESSLRLKVPPPPIGFLSSFSSSSVNVIQQKYEESLKKIQSSTFLSLRQSLQNSNPIQLELFRKSKENLLKTIEENKKQNENGMQIESNSSSSLLSMITEGTEEILQNLSKLNLFFSSHPNSILFESELQWNPFSFFLSNDFIDFRFIFESNHRIFPLNSKEFPHFIDRFAFILFELESEFRLLVSDRIRKKWNPQLNSVIDIPKEEIFLLFADFVFPSNLSSFKNIDSYLGGFSEFSLWNRRRFGALRGKGFLISSKIELIQSIKQKLAEKSETKDQIKNLECKKIELEPSMTIAIPRVHLVFFGSSPKDSIDFPNTESFYLFELICLFNSLRKGGSAVFRISFFFNHPFYLSFVFLLSKSFDLIDLFRPKSTPFHQINELFLICQSFKFEEKSEEFNEILSFLNSLFSLSFSSFSSFPSHFFLNNYLFFDEKSILLLDGPFRNFILKSQKIFSNFSLSAALKSANAVFELGKKKNLYLNSKEEIQKGLINELQTPFVSPNERTQEIIYHWLRI